MALERSPRACRLLHARIGSLLLIERPETQGLRVTPRLATFGREFSPASLTEGSQV